MKKNNHNLKAVLFMHAKNEVQKSEKHMEIEDFHEKTMKSKKKRKKKEKTTKKKTSEKKKQKKEKQSQQKEQQCKTFAK